MKELGEALKEINMTTGVYSKIIDVIESDKNKDDFSALIRGGINEFLVNDIKTKLHKRKYQLHESIVNAFCEKLSSYYKNNR